MKIAVIGAGVFGAWSAWFLARRGYDVTLVDAYGPANPRASSADHSRVIRCGYGGDAIYSTWARASMDDWHWLSRETGHDLVVTCGALFMGAPDDPYVKATGETLSALNLPCEWLEASALGARFPQIDSDGLGRSLLEPGAGVVRARAAVQALVAMMQRRSIITYRAARVSLPDESASQPRFDTADGTPLVADAFVCACGPWLPRMFPHAVGSRIRATRQEVLHFGPPPGDHRYSLAHLPVWIDFQAGFYGIPDFDARGFKVGVDRHGPPIDPDRAERLVEAAAVASARTFLARRFPALATAPLVDSHVCQYENTPTGDFLIDRHPHWANVWLVGGGSGHGFKHGPAVGRYVAGLVSGEPPAEVRFQLSAKGMHAARSVF